jgi:hypothetical protein
MLFIVRASLDANGQLHGVVTHAQTGRKERFAGAVPLGDLIAAMAGQGEERTITGLDKLDEDAK